RIERFAHQNRVQMELVIGNADQVNQHVGSSYGCPRGDRVVRIPGHDFGLLISTKGGVETGPAAPDGAVSLPFPPQRFPNAFADPTGGAYERDLGHKASHLL